MNKNKNQKNQLGVKCAISGEYIPQGQAVCSNIASNNTSYYAEKYHNLFSDMAISQNLQNALLTCVVIGGSLQVNNTLLQAYKTNCNINNTIYAINFNCGIKLYCNGSNAQVKKYLNQLTTYKKAIKSITYKNIKNQDIEISNINNNPTYIRQKYLFEIGISYNPDSKKTISKVW